jgi:hypothetical protein
MGFDPGLGVYPPQMVIDTTPLFLSLPSQYGFTNDQFHADREQSILYRRPPAQPLLLNAMSTLRGDGLEKVAGSQGTFYFLALSINLIYEYLRLEPDA